MSKASSPTKTCFVVGPVGSDDSERRIHADWLLEEIIEPVFKEHFPSYRVRRSDRLPKPGMIDSEMIRLLVESELVIADLSYENPNAFYEIGIRHMVRKPIVHMHLEGQTIPFDVAPHRSIKFQLKRPSDLRAAQKALQEAVAETEGPGFEVTNPVTHAMGVVKIDQSADSATQVILEEMRSLKSRLEQVERGEIDSIHRAIDDSPFSKILGLNPGWPGVRYLEKDDHASQGERNPINDIRGEARRFHSFGLFQSTPTGAFANEQNKRSSVDVGDLLIGNAAKPSVPRFKTRCPGYRYRVFEPGELLSSG